MQENKETGRRRGSPATRAVRCLKKAVAGVLSAAMVLTGMPAITALAAVEPDENNVISVSTEEDLNDAIAYVNEQTEGEFIISLQNDITLDSDDDLLTVDAEGVTVTILGNGYTIDDEDDAEGHVLGASGGTLNLGASDGSDTLTITSNKEDHATALIYVTDGTVNMYGGVKLENNHVSDSTVYGGAVHIEGGTFNMYGGEIDNCSAHYGGAIGASGGTLNITGGEIDTNDSVGGNSRGSAIYVTGSGTTANISNITIENNEVVENEAEDESEYGAVTFDNGSMGVLTNVTIKDNISYCGGAVCIDNSNVTINNSTIKDNRTIKSSGKYGQGGGIYVTGSDAKLTVNGGEISGNVSAGDGGGIYSGQGATLTLNGVTITGNSVGLYYDEVDGAEGAGLAIVGSSSVKCFVTIENCVITGNEAYPLSNRYGYGGGIYFVDAGTEENPATVTNSTITGNSANYGGGFYINHRTVVEFSNNSILANNKASTAGADVYNNDSTSTITLPNAAKMNVIYEADGKGNLIDGWYEDSNSNRYQPSTDGTPYTGYENITSSVALVASYSTEYFDIDEEIVPDRKENDSDSWVREAEVSENTAIEFEMSTTLPHMSEGRLEELANGDEFTMVFHNVLDEELKLDSEEGADLHITIGDRNISSDYYEVDINDLSGIWTLSADTADDDGCSFHVTVDLKKLYEDGKISADDFNGETEIIVFFYADLEGAEYGGEYTSTVWYGIYDETEDPIHVSEQAKVTVSVIAATLNVTFYPGLFGTLEGETEFKVTYGDSFNNDIPVVIPQDGYEFDCWVGSDGEEYYDDDFLDLVITADMTFTAVYKMTDSDAGYGTISVTKEVDNMPEGADISYNFALVMELMETESSSDASRIVVETDNNASHIETDSNASRKVVEFQLKDGQTTTFYGIPAGWTYEVVETSQSTDYDTEASAEGAETTTFIDEDGFVYIAATMESGDEVTVTYVNTYEENEDNGGNNNPDTEEPGSTTEPGPSTEEPDESAPFEFTKTSSRGETTVSVGTTLTYTISYQNNTDETATITIVDPLDAGLTYSSASDGGVYDSSNRTVTWTIEDVKPGEEGSVTVTARVNYTGRTEGRVTNTAELTVEGLESGTYEANSSTSNTVSRTTSSSSSGSGSSGSTTSISHVRNVNNGKTGHWILEGGYLTLPDGSHPSNEYLNVDGEVWAFYTYGYAVAKRHTEYYTSAALAAVGYIPEVTGTWETIGWWFEYDDGTYPHNEWAQLEYNGKTYWYHFDVDGWMDDGWFYENGNTYYLDPVYDGWRGHMMTGWQEIDGYWYYFEDSGALLKNGTTPDGYTVDGNGRWVE